MSLDEVRGQSDQPLPKLQDMPGPMLQALAQEIDYQSLLGEALANGFAKFDMQFEGQSYLASITTFDVSNQKWGFGIVTPRSDFLSRVDASERMSLGASIAAMLGAILIAIALARTVTRPVVAMLHFVQRVSQGELEARADFGQDQQFREVASALNEMVTNVNDHIKLRESLKQAEQIQQQLLPREAPLVPGVDLYGQSQYCDETGGDYFDFISVQSQGVDHTLLVLGDVMGHGVSASLVMAAVRAVLRDRAEDSIDLGQLMQRLNTMLSRDLAGTRFMTMHLGLLNHETFEYSYASAGHDPAMVIDTDAQTVSQPDGGDLPLGVLSDTKYETYHLGPLPIGTLVYLGTDGVWEMHDPTGKAFGKDRLQSTLMRTAHTPAKEVAHHLSLELTAYRGDEEATDDVTMIVFRIVPKA